VTDSQPDRQTAFRTDSECSVSRSNWIIPDGPLMYCAPLRYLSSSLRRTGLVRFPIGGLGRDCCCNMINWISRSTTSNSRTSSSFSRRRSDCSFTCWSIIARFRSSSRAFSSCDQHFTEIKHAAWWHLVVITIVVINVQITRSSATAEIARVGGRYAVQGHSGSLMLVPIESPYVTSYQWILLTYNLYRTVFQLPLSRRQIIAYDKVLPTVNALVLGNLCEYRQKVTYWHDKNFPNYYRLLIKFVLSTVFRIPVFNPLVRGEPLNTTAEIWPQKLETTSLYHVVQTAFRYLEPFRRGLLCQCHSRSLMLVPIESLYATSYQWIILICNLSGDATPCGQNRDQMSQFLSYNKV